MSQDTSTAPSATNAKKGIGLFGLIALTRK